MCTESDKITEFKFKISHIIVWVLERRGVPILWQRESQTQFYVLQQFHKRIDRFYVMSYHFRSLYWCSTFDCIIQKWWATIIIPLVKMDSKERETNCQNNCGVNYSFPISEYAKQLDLPVRDRNLQKISTIRIDPVLVEGKDRGRTLIRAVCFLLNLQIFCVILSWSQRFLHMATV